MPLFRKKFNYIKLNAKYMGTQYVFHYRFFLYLLLPLTSSIKMIVYIKVFVLYLFYLALLKLTDLGFSPITRFQYLLGSWPKKMLQMQVICFGFFVLRSSQYLWLKKLLSVTYCCVSRGASPSTSSTISCQL